MLSHQGHQRSHCICSTFSNIRFFSCCSLRWDKWLHLQWLQISSKVEPQSPSEPISFQIQLCEPWRCRRTSGSIGRSELLMVHPAGNYFWRCSQLWDWSQPNWWSSWWPRLRLYQGVFAAWIRFQTRWNIFRTLHPGRGRFCDTNWVFPPTHHHLSNLRSLSPVIIGHTSD